MPAKLLEPTTPRLGHPDVAIIHGYSGNSSGWLEKLGGVSEGLASAVLDSRGQGLLSEDPDGI